MQTNNPLRTCAISSRLVERSLESMLAPWHSRCSCVARALRSWWATDYSTATTGMAGTTRVAAISAASGPPQTPKRQRCASAARATPPRAHCSRRATTCLTVPVSLPAGRARAHARSRPAALPTGPLMMARRATGWTSEARARRRPRLAVYSYANSSPASSCRQP